MYEEMINLYDKKINDDDNVLNVLHHHHHHQIRMMNLKLMLPILHIHRIELNPDNLWLIMFVFFLIIFLEHFPDRKYLFD